MEKLLGMTPPMGWNSWNTFTWEINEELIKQAADAFIENGLKDAGYEYVVIDDCWSEKQRNEKGELVPDHLKFPNGIKINTKRYNRSTLNKRLFIQAKRSISS